VVDEYSPKKGWLYIAANEAIVLILYSLVEEKLKKRRLDKRIKSDLTVIQSLLFQLIAKPQAIPRREDA